MDDLNLKKEDLMFMGLQKLAYVRAIEDNGENLFAIYAADGTELANAKNENEAKALIIKNEMRQAILH